MRLRLSKIEQGEQGKSFTTMAQMTQRENKGQSPEHNLQSLNKLFLCSQYSPFSSANSIP